MSETAHVLEELRSLRGAHADVLIRLTEVCSTMRELVVELKHQQRSSDALGERISRNEEAWKERIEKLEEAVVSVQIENATNKPIMDIAKRMYWNQWITLIAAGGGTVGMNWSKLFGG